MTLQQYVKRNKLPLLNVVVRRKGELMLLNSLVKNNELSPCLTDYLNNKVTHEGYEHYDCNGEIIKTVRVDPELKG